STYSPTAGLANCTARHQPCRLRSVPPLRPPPDRTTYPGQDGLQVTIVEDVRHDAKRDDRAAGREYCNGNGNELVMEGHCQADSHAHCGGRHAAMAGLASCVAGTMHR